MSSDGQGTKWRRNIAENFNRLSRVHERYRQTTDDRRQTDGRRHIANVNISSRSLKKINMCHQCLQFLHIAVQKEEAVSRVMAEVGLPLFEQAVGGADDPLAGR